METVPSSFYAKEASFAPPNCSSVRKSSESLWVSLLPLRGAISAVTSRMRSKSVNTQRPQFASSEEAEEQAGQELERRLLFILHGERAESQEVRDLLQHAADAPCTHEVTRTAAAGDAVRIARDGASSGFTSIIAVGGDGTVNEVVNGLAGSTTPLGIIPMGTANDFARQLGIPESAKKALELILDGHTRAIDTITVNDRHFANVSMGGIAADVTAETSPGLKEFIGPFAYAITGLKKLAAVESRMMTFTGPNFELIRPTLLFAVGNARSTGGGYELTSHARVQDGLLDLCVVEEMPLTSLIPLMIKLRNAEHAEAEGVHYIQLPWVDVKADEQFRVNVDGEELNGSRFHYVVNPRALTVHLDHLPEDQPAEG